ncbi:hypothetical protein Patl1_16242 [Pistacia atlantica]|uniref:Uncharacterized protein n=1 Tax=Pistacia atlantica TaxID=434234 RepID=A0ACC1B6Z0_9ROSI|nr:hypothetical protein Patl1_16242 [Pistacia atlantica]
MSSNLLFLSSLVPHFHHHPLSVFCYLPTAPSISTKIRRRARKRKKKEG